MLLRIRYTYPKAPVDTGRQKSTQIFNVMLIILRILAACGMIISVYPVPAVGLWYYGLSIAMLLLLIVTLILTNRLNNEFVTRPVPILGKEAE